MTIGLTMMTYDVVENQVLNVSVNVSEGVLGVTVPVNVTTVDDQATGKDRHLWRSEVRRVVSVECRMQ